MTIGNVGLTRATLGSIAAVALFCVLPLAIGVGSAGALASFVAPLEAVTLSAAALGGVAILGRRLFGKRREREAESSNSTDPAGVRPAGAGDRNGEDENEDRAGGFHLGPELALSRLDVTHRESGETAGRLNYSVGLRGGYRWYTGLGGLYFNPVGGLMYTLNAGDIDLADESFETGSLTPFVTVGAGWSFRL